jgi:hypothetical protein
LLILRVHSSGILPSGQVVIELIDKLNQEKAKLISANERLRGELLKYEKKWLNTASTQ